MVFIFFFCLAAPSSTSFVQNIHYLSSAQSQPCHSNCNLIYIAHFTLSKVTVLKIEGQNIKTWVVLEFLMISSVPLTLCSFTVTCLPLIDVHVFRLASTRAQPLQALFHLIPDVITPPLWIHLSFISQLLVHFLSSPQASPTLQECVKQCVQRVHCPVF